METIKMTTVQFINFIKSIKGCQFINLIALTDADMYLRNNPYKGRVQKHITATLQVNYDYEKAVNNRLQREGNEPAFEAYSLPWGHWLEGMVNKVLEHKGKHYLRTYLMRNNPHLEVVYLLDGKPVSENEYNLIKEFLKPSSTSNRQTQHGLDDELQVKPRTFSFESIKEITINHTKIVLED